jgi:hypothetical protein
MESWQTLAITGALTLIGVWLGSHLAGRTEHAKWLREQKQTAYSNFLAHAGLDDMGQIIDGAILMPDYLTRQFATMQRMTLLAPDHISHLAQEVITTAKDVSRALAGVEQHELSAALEQHQLGYGRAVSRLTFAMRLDLHKLSWRARVGYKGYLKDSRS